MPALGAVAAAAERAVSRWRQMREPEMPAAGPRLLAAEPESALMAAAKAVELRPLAAAPELAAVARAAAKAVELRLLAAAPELAAVARVAAAEPVEAPAAGHWLPAAKRLPPAAEQPESAVA